jgi:hypothetical protein
MIAVVKYIIILLKIIIEMNYLKPNRGFRGILSNVGLCLPPLSGILNFDADVKCKEICMYC